MAFAFPKEQVSLAHDLSGKSGPFWRGWDAPDGSPSGGAHGGVFERSGPLGIGGAEPGRGGGVFGGERADVPALDAPLRGGGRGGSLGPQAWQGVGQAGSG